MKHIAIIGAGPVGLEAALEGVRRGFAVTLYEAGRLGEHFLQYGPVRLFTPFHMNASALGRARLREEGIALPGEDAILTAESHCRQYLGPLARLPELRGALREGERVLGVGRAGVRKPHLAGVPGPGGRAGRRFLLHVQAAGGPRLDTADIVVDASGVYATPNATGPGGLEALGEGAVRDRVEYHLPAIATRDRARYSGRRTILIGDGRSAANALADFAALIAEEGPESRTRVEWIHRDREGGPFAPLPPEALQTLPELRALHERATELAAHAPWLRRHPGATVLGYDPLPSGAVRVRIAASADGDAAPGRASAPGSLERVLEGDRVLALVGYRPDPSLTRELQVHLCYASEGPMALAAAIQAAERSDPAAVADCLSQAVHGAESLRTPEPDFYVLGAKSYGRNPNFLMSLGHAQVAEVFELIGGGAPGASSTDPVHRAPVARD